MTDGRRARKARALLVGLAALLLLAGVAPAARAQKVVATIPTGGGPYGLAVAPDGKHVYAGNIRARTVSVIDTATNTVTATVPNVTSPVFLAAAPDGKHVYAATYGGNRLDVIDTATNTLTAQIPVGGYPSAVAVTPDGTRAYVANLTSNDVSVVDTATDTVVKTIGVGSYPDGIAVSPDGAHVWVAGEYGNFLDVIDTATDSVISSQSLSGSPQGIAFSPDGATAYVTLVGSSAVAVVDTATHQVTRTIGGLGTYSRGIAVSPDGSRLYVVNTGSGSMSVVDPVAGAVLDTVHVGDAPFWIGLSPDGGFAYTANRDTNDVSVIDLLAGPPTITSADGASFTTGVPGTFTVTTKGRPTAALTESGDLPSGVGFHDNGDGTATLSGTPASGTAGGYDLTLTATSSLGEDDQAFTLTVGKATPAIGLEASGDGQVDGRPVTLTATVTPPGGDTLAPGGTVSFYVNGADAPAATVDVRDGAATWDAASLPAGEDSVVARYGGDENFAPASSEPVSVRIARAPTTLTAAPAVLQLGGLKLRLFGLSAMLKGPAGPVAGAPVSFTAGSTHVCDAVTDASGTATCSGIGSVLQILLGLGYQAEFAGDEGHLPSTASAGLVG